MKSSQVIQIGFFFLVAVFVLGASDTQAAPGDVDLTFNPQISSSGFGPYIYAVRMQPDGKSVIAGQFDTVNGQSRNLVARFNTDGSLDDTFNSPFTATSGSPPNQIIGLAQDVVIQPDGRLIVAGGVLTLGAQTKVLVRLNADGTLDNTFNPNIDASNIYKIVLQPDGKIIIGSNGLNTVDGVPVNYLARLNTNGTLDTALGAVGNLPSSVFAIALQTDGKIVVGGSGYLVRLNANGTNDSGFTQTLADITFYAVAIQADGRIVAGGTNRISFVPVLIRVNSNGSPDSGFTVTLQFTGTVYTLLVQDSGKILIGGSFARVNGTVRFGIARLNPDATLDPFYPNPFGVSDNIYGMAVQSDEKILIAGQFEWVGDENIPRSGFARLLDGPQTPPTPPTKLKVAGGNVLIGSPGQGLILRSPGGAVCKSIGIDNTGAMTVQSVACP